LLGNRSPPPLFFVRPEAAPDGMSSVVAKTQPRS
jgi:hypothetical protein